jgi:hypothetical protein
LKYALGKLFTKTFLAKRDGVSGVEKGPIQKKGFFLSSITYPYREQSIESKKG